MLPTPVVTQANPYSETPDNAYANFFAALLVPEYPIQVRGRCGMPGKTALDLGDFLFHKVPYFTSAQPCHSTDTRRFPEPSSFSSRRDFPASRRPNRANLALP